MPALQAQARISTPRILAWSADSGSLAYMYNGLKQLELATGEVFDPGIDQVESLAWGGSGLSVSVPVKDGYRLVLIESTGHRRILASGEGAIVAQLWADDTLYALLVRHKFYSFGVNQQIFLLSWSRAEGVDETLLADTTLDPSTPGRAGVHFPYGPYLKLSPFKDEIIYSRLHDPPAFNPEYRVFVRNLATGSERLLGRHALTQGAAVYTADGEHVLISDGRSRVDKVSTWGESRHEFFDTPAAALDVTGLYVYRDGTLQWGQKPIWSNDALVRGLFSPDGSKLAMLTTAHLYIARLSTPSIEVESSPERLKLRRLRALGLISQDDYKRFIKESF